MLNFIYDNNYKDSKEEDEIESQHDITNTSYLYYLVDRLIEKVDELEDKIDILENNS